MKKACKYGAKCYRKNPDHLREFDHPEKPTIEADSPPQKRLCTAENGPKETVCSSPSPPSDSAEERPLTPQTRSNGENEVTATAAPSIGDSDDYSDDILPESPTDVRANLKQKFGLDFPEDFYSFLEFCRSLNDKHPEDALQVCGLTLAGPFRVLLGLTSGHVRSSRFYMTYCRFYYDPPEFQTMLYGSSETGYHIGYYRDSPEEMPALVMANHSEKDAKFTALGDNLFAAVNAYIVTTIRDSDDKTPFQVAPLSSLQSSLRSWAELHRFTLETSTQALRARQKRVVARTLQNIGLVVPYDKKTELGYRDLGETHASLRKMFGAVATASTPEARARAYDVVQELVTNIQFANDEGDPGAGLELGLNAFAFGSEALHKTVRHLLPVAYELLERTYFADVITEHLRKRRTGVPPL